MPTAENTIKAQPRQTGGKNDARRLRKTGLIPGALYGAAKPAVPVAVDPKEISRILHSESGHNTIFDLAVNGGNEKVMIVDWQYEPLKGKLLHVDMKRIAMDQVLQISVPVVLKGVPEGVKTQGGILEQVVREVEIECLPADIPSAITVDVSAMVFGQNLRVADLPHGDKLTFLSDPDQLVAHVVAVKEEVEAPAAEAVAAEGEAAPAEPEVIKKGKQEAEGEGEGAEKPEKAEKKK